MSQLRKVARAIFPLRGLRYWVSAEYRERCAWDRDRAMGNVAYGCTGGLVAGGPFKGLRYVDSAMGSTLGPKLLGTYEKELNHIVERIIARAYGTVVNIGAGEGYYAVGLATRMPDSRIICFEAFEKNRDEHSKNREEHAKNQILMTQVLESINSLARIAHAHERRITNLEDRPT